MAANKIEIAKRMLESRGKSAPPPKEQAEGGAGSGAEPEIDPDSIDVNQYDRDLEDHEIDHDIDDEDLDDLEAEDADDDDTVWDLDDEDEEPGDGEAGKDAATKRILGTDEDQPQLMMLKE